MNAPRPSPKGPLRSAPMNSAYGRRDNPEIQHPILPLTLFARLVGVPIAAVLAHRARRRIARHPDPLGGSGLALIAVFLAQALTWSGIAVLGYLLGRMGMLIR